MTINEFGSDYHLSESNQNLIVNWPLDSVFFGSGREALVSIILKLCSESKSKRVWIPSYYCGEVIEKIELLDIDIKIYNDNPLINSDKEIENIKFEYNDILIRVNYFGLRSFQPLNIQDVIIVEDHSHSFFTDCCQTSSADYCFCSLRKELPITDGGILWSPKKLNLFNCEVTICADQDCLANERYLAMKMKKEYLQGGGLDLRAKNFFRSKFMETESIIGSNSKITEISSVARRMLREIPLHWIDQKRSNYSLLNSEVCGLRKLNSDSNLPFSLILLFDHKKDREAARNMLIENMIYPAVYWPKNKWMTEEDIALSEQMLSIPCDGRYNEKDILILSVKIKEIFKQLEL